VGSLKYLFLSSAVTSKTDNAEKYGGGEGKGKGDRELRS